MRPDAKKAIQEFDDKEKCEFISGAIEAALRKQGLLPDKKATMQQLLDEIKAQGTFKNVSDPLKWQSELRDEWS